MTEAPQTTPTYPLVVARFTGWGRRAKMQSNPTAGARKQGRDRQVPLIQPQIDAVANQLHLRQATPAATVATDDNEDIILVWELRGSVDDLRNTVKHLSGLEVLADDLLFPEELQDDAEPGEDAGDEADEAIDGDTVYVLANSLAACEEVLDLWDLWTQSDKPTFPRGLAPWKTVFALLKTVRPWSPVDRIAALQLKQWHEELDSGQDTFRIIVELWSRRSDKNRRTDLTDTAEILAQLGARILSVQSLTSIAFDGILAEVDRATMLEIVALSSPLVGLNSVAFIRGQSLASDTLIGNPTNVTLVPAEPTDSRPPLVALLDSVPDTSLPLLSAMLHSVAPPGIVGGDIVTPREHGTSMASAVVYGDLVHGTANALQRRLTVLPILTWTVLGPSGSSTDAMSLVELSVAVLSAALTELFPDGAEDAWPRVIVLAVGADPVIKAARPGALARLIDDWSAKYNVLFIVSAGNHVPTDITLPEGTTDEQLADPHEVTKLLADHVTDARGDQGILSPGEATNALTVGSNHGDAIDVEIPAGGAIVDLLAGVLAPSPYSRTGQATPTRFIKPEVLVSTGRALFRRNIFEPDKHIYEPVSAGPDFRGVLTAASGPVPSVKTQGTSLAAALMGHRAGRLMEILGTDTDGLTLVSRRELAVATKALIVNSASWDGAEQYLAGLSADATLSERRILATKILGYGTVDEERVAIGSAQRVSVLVTGFINEDGARYFDFPLPVSLAGQAEWRRLSVTLAWMTPINSTHQQYRKAKLWFNIDELKDLLVFRKQANHRRVRHGTVQHEVFEGSDITDIAAGDGFEVGVHYAGAAGGDGGSVHYGLVVTFEVGPDSDVPVYEEVTAALRARAGASARIAPSLIEVRTEA